MSVIEMTPIEKKKINFAEEGPQKDFSVYSSCSVLAGIRFTLNFEEAVYVQKK